MRPNTIHYVISTQDTIALGGHFYNKEDYTNTLFAMVAEHFVGNLVTNTTHQNAPVILLREFSRYVDICARKEERKNL